MSNYKMDTLAYSFRRIETALGKLADVAAHKKSHETGIYDFIPLCPSVFLSDIDFAKSLFDSDVRIKFLDVGCGIGTKLVLASGPFNYNVDGIEINKKYVDFYNNKFSKFLFPFENAPKIFHADGRTFERYNEYDVIYFYCPMCKYELQRELEKQIVARAKKGAIIIGHLYKYLEEARNNKLIERVNNLNHIFRKL